MYRLWGDKMKIESINVRNDGYVYCKSGFYHSQDSTDYKTEYIFTTGVNWLIGEIDSGCWAAVSYTHLSNWATARRLYKADYYLNETVFTDAINRRTTYQFNSVGLTTGVFDDKGNVSSADYSDKRESKTKITQSAGSAGESINYLINGDFSRNGKEGWTDNGTCEVVSGGLISGNAVKFLSLIHIYLMK